MRRAALLLLPLLLAACLDQPGLPAPAVSIAPGDPGSDDDLQLVLEEIAQGDGRPDLSFDISWSVDGLAVDDLAGAREVGAARTAAGQTWSATVRFELDQQLGPAAEASVTIGGAGDDDDLAGDVQAGLRLCGAAGRSTNGSITAVSCTGPEQVAPGTATNGTFTVTAGALRVVGE